MTRLTSDRDNPTSSFEAVKNRREQAASSWLCKTSIGIDIPSAVPIPLVHGMVLTPSGEIRPQPFSWNAEGEHIASNQSFDESVSDIFARRINCDLEASTASQNPEQIAHACYCKPVGTNVRPSSEN